MFNKSTLQSIIEFSGFDTRSYSGRGMYGKECLGVSLGMSTGQFFAQVFDDVIRNNPSEEEKEAFSEALKHFKTDSMGRGQIVYWENVEYASGDEEEDEDPSGEE